MPPSAHRHPGRMKRARLFQHLCSTQAASLCSLAPSSLPAAPGASGRPHCRAACSLLQGLLTSPLPSQTAGAAIPGSPSFSFSLTSVLKVGRTCPKYLAEESNPKHRDRPPARSQPLFPLPPAQKGHSFRHSKMDTFFFFGPVSGQHPLFSGYVSLYRHA